MWTLFLQVKEVLTCHIFVHCVKTGNLWGLVLALFVLQWHFQSLLACFSQIRIRQECKKDERERGTWPLYASFWCIWKEARNKQQNFQGRGASKLSIRRLFLENFGIRNPLWGKPSDIIQGLDQDQVVSVFFLSFGFSVFSILAMCWGCTFFFG